MNFSANQLAVIDELLLSGDMIAAIREHRGFTGAELVDAKRFIDCRLEQLQREQPLRFPTTTSLPTLDPKIQRQIEPLLEHDLEPARSTLTEMEEILYGYNYAVSLSVNAATLPTSELPIKEVMSVFYPDSTPHDSTILPVRPEELVKDVTECLTYDGDYSAGPQFTEERFQQLSRILVPNYWR